MLPPPDDRPTGFFGRTPEMGRLRSVASSVRESEGRGRAILVTGAAGVGKSRLLSELKREMRAAGQTVLECAWRPIEDRPHGPLMDLLAAGARMMQDLGRMAHRTERALTLVTGLAESITEAGARDKRSLHLYETVRQALIELADVHPPVLFVHDAHLADPASIGLLRYLIENLLTDPAFDWTPPETEAEAQTITELAFRGLLIISFRETEVTRPLTETARASAAVEHVPLTGLDAESVRTFLQSQEVVERFLRASNGLPLNLQQLVDTMPRAPENIWRRQVEGLAESSKAMLDLLATHERPCSLHQVAAMADLKRDLRPVVTDLVERGLLVRNLSGGTVRFSFSHTTIRERWARAMDPERAVALHRHVAERLAAGMSAEPERIAYHYLAGGTPAEAVPYAVAAADRLQAACADPRAAGLLEQVVDVAEGALRVEIIDRLADLYTAAGDVPAARRTLDLLAEADPARVGPRLDVRHAELLTRAADYGQARTTAEKGLDGDPEDETREALTALAADAAYRLGDIDAAEAYCATLADGDTARPTHAGLNLRNTNGKVHLFREALEEAEEIFKMNLALAQSIDDHANQARALINLGVVYLQKGSIEAALDIFERARQLCTANNDLRHLSISLENLGVLHHRRQAYSRALSYYHQSTAASRRLGLRPQLAATALNLCELYLAVGDRGRARRLHAIANEYITRDRMTFLEPQSLLLEGDLARSDGELDRAANRYALAISQVESGGGTNQRLGSLLWSQAELLLEKGEPTRAAGIVEQALGVPAGQSEAVSVRLRMTRGGIHSAQEDLDAAQAELTAAVHGAQQRGDHEVAWLALARLAEVEWKRKYQKAALRALTGSVETIERVAAELPSSLRTLYRNTPKRRLVREAISRIRAGLPLEADLAPVGDLAEKRRRRRGRYRSRWAKRYPRIVGRDPALHPVFNALDRVARSDSMVLIRGESGTGKELVAAALHDNSPRAASPFVKVNCAAFVETLLLSELFGHEKGAFTGAVSGKKGRFELADGGTLFLDEIGDISHNTQVALLRVLQERTFERVGGTSTLRVDVRVVCATHRNLEEMVGDGSFRADLYYRLRGVIIELPALRQRTIDIPLLARHFLNLRVEHTKRSLDFTRTALASLIQHDWPGNVRELENVVRSVALFADGNRIGLEELSQLGDIFSPPEEAALVALSEMIDKHPDVARAVETTAPEEMEPESTDSSVAGVLDPLTGPLPKIEVGITDAWLERMLQHEGSLSDLKKRIEYEAIARALRGSKGNITKAAETLGMKRPRLSQIIHATPKLGAVKREASDS